MTADILFWLGIGLLDVCVVIPMAHSIRPISYDISRSYFRLIALNLLLFVASATAQYTGW